MAHAHCPRAAKAEITLISIVTALCLVGDSFLYVALPLHWEAAGLATLFEVGAILAANRLVRIPLNPLITLFYNKVSCRTGIWLATVLAILSTAGYGLVQGLFLWVCMRFLWGLSWTLLRLGTLFTILRVSTPQSLGYLTGINNGLYRLGSLAGMLLGGLLADSFGLQTTALFFAAVSCLAPLVMLKMPRSDESGEKHGEENGKESGEESGDGSSPGAGTDTAAARRAQAAASMNWKAIFAGNPGPVLWVMMTAFVVAMTYQGVTASTISMLLEAHSREKLALLGLTLSAATLSGGLQAMRWVWEPFLAPFFGSLSDGRLGRCRLSAAAFALSALTLLPGALELDLAALCVVIILVLLGGTLLTTATDALGNDAALLSGNSRTYLSAFALFTDLGAAAGPLVAYTIIALADTGLAWVLTAAFLAVFAVYWWLHPSLERQAAQAAR